VGDDRDPPDLGAAVSRDSLKTRDRWTERSRPDSALVSLPNMMVLALFPAGVGVPGA
jgi:hypothetical protein